MREEVGSCFKYHTHEELAEKSLGRNYDLSVAEYKVEKETKHLGQLQEQVHDAEVELQASRKEHSELEKRQTKELEEKTQAIVAKNETLETEYEEKKEQYNSELTDLENKRSNEKILAEIDKKESERLAKEIKEKQVELQIVNQNIIADVKVAEKVANTLMQIKDFITSFRLFAPTIEEYANQVEADKSIEAGIHIE